MFSFGLFRAIALEVIKYNLLHVPGVRENRVEWDSIWSKFFQLDRGSP